MSNFRLYAAPLKNTIGSVQETRLEFMLDKAK